MNSAHLGEYQVDLGGEKLTIVFTLRSRSQIKTAFGDKASLTALLSGEDAEAFAKLLAIGLARHHPGITAEQLLEMSIPLEPTRAALINALNWSIFGPDGPPKPKKQKDDAAENPQ
jgi:hypothetical protein